MKYSIVLPVRNGGEYVKQCIDSILSQSLQDFNLEVLENNSTDGTAEWINSLSDQRIRVHPAKEPLSIEENWGRVSNIPKNEFLTIIGHDDLLDRNYLQVMEQLIQSRPDASLYQAHFRYVDASNIVLRKSKPMAAVQKPADVIQNFLWSKMDIMGTGFMTRSRDYDAIGGIPAYQNLLFADMELWIELARKSYLAVASEECFSYRVHPGATTPNSTDVKVLNAFEQFVGYLSNLKKRDPELSNTITNSADIFLGQYCKGITHKVLRTAHKKRQTPSVAAIINRFREYGKQLKGDNSFEPLDSSKIKLGKTIDENPILHSLFLLFKRIYRKPVL